MRKKVFKNLICFLLAVIMITECNVGAFITYAAEIIQEEVSDEIVIQKNEEEFRPTGSSYLYPFEEAVTTLETMAAERKIQAVVYLADSIILRTLPEDRSEPVKILSSGDVVNIIGVGQDTEYNIWYRISYVDEIEEVTGYIRKENVACVDKEFIKWQDNYVRSISMWNRMRSGVSYSDVDMFPESYQDALMKLKEEHPNWIFVKMNTNIDWTTLVKSQIGNRSWIWAPTAKENWKNGMTSTTNWAYASEGIIKYYLEPRNWLGEKNIFQFELLGYDSQYHTVENVESILNGTFMANKVVENNLTYAQTFVELGKVTGVSPFLMAARVRQEQGVNGTGALISGTYAGYEGYYNYYNIGATGKTDKETIINGLKKAVEKGWNTRYKALKGGAEFLGGEYINAGQDTLYLQKFDVDNRMYGVFSHQYMQNIQAPYTEARSVYKAYNNKGLLNQAFIFRIPVYNNMQTKAVVLPGEEDKITLSSTNIDNLQVDSEVTLRPYVNGKEAEGVEWKFTSSDESIAKVDNSGVVKALKPGEVTITCENAMDMENTIAGTCKIKVILADIDISKIEIPVLVTVTYDPDATLKTVKLPEGYSWLNPDMKLLVSQNKYSVVYCPDEGKYNPITFDITLIVNKRQITSAEYVIPTDLIGGAGRELGSVALPAGFYWNDPTQMLPDTIGTNEYYASYNFDSDNYETVTDIKISVKIVCEKHRYSEWEVEEATCEENGNKVRHCKICQYKEELVLEKTGHHYESVITEEATEEKEGSRTYTCKNCGSNYIESISKLPSTHVHEYEEEVTKKASCTESGLKTYICSCEDKYTEIIEATGHKMDNGHCQNCGYTEAVETPKEENKPSDGGSKDESDEPSDSGNKEEGNIGKPEDKENDNSSSNNSSDNNSSENNSTTSNSSTNITITPNDNVTNNNTSTESTINNTANSDKNTESTNNNNSDTTVDKKPENIVISTETKPQAVSEKKNNQVELELMSELVENVKEEGESGEKPKVEIQLNKNTDISQKIVEMAKDHGVDLELSLPNNLKWTINAESLNDKMASSINMNAKIVEEVVDRKAIEAVTNTEEYMELSLSHDGEFGFEATLTIPVEEKYVGQVANLFYFNEKIKELEFQMDAPVDEEGYIQLFFNHASDYVIVFSQNSMTDIVTDIGIITDEGESTEEITNADETKSKTGGLMTACVIIMILAGGMAGAGYFIYFNKKEISDGKDFEEWLKDDGNLSKETVAEKEKSIKEEVPKRSKTKKEDKYLDEDVDDYKEKEKESEVIFNTGEIRLKEEDYLDEDVDDYQEKEGNVCAEEESEYLDDDIDDYREKN